MIVIMETVISMRVTQLCWTIRVEAGITPAGLPVAGPTGGMR